MNEPPTSNQRQSRWQHWYGLARIGRLARKELAEILCDRRTILTLVLMPLLLYTLLSFAFRQFLMAFMTSSTVASKELTIGVDTEEQKRIVEAYLAFGAEVPWWRVCGMVGLQSPPATPGPLMAVSYSLAGRFPHEPHIFLPSYDPVGRKGPTPLSVEVKSNARKALAYGEIDVALRVSPSFSLAQLARESPLAVSGIAATTVGMLSLPQGTGPLLAASTLYPGRVIRPHPLALLIEGKRPMVLNWDVRFLQFSPRSREVVYVLDQHVNLANARQLRGILTKRGSAVPPVPVRVVRLGVETSEPAPGLSLTALVPLILILMTITGAVYPAMDPTAGERERGTLEILVAAPVPRLALLLAKYIAVVAVAMLTATVNLAMMLVTLHLNGLTGEVFKQTGITVQLVVELFFLLVLFAAFFSAVLLALTSFARSFKEAQAYLIPLMLASLVPGVVGMMPGLRLQGILAVTPLVNIVLLARDLAERKASIANTAAVVVSTLVYAAAAITVAARLFGAEAVLFSEQSSWSDLIRRPSKPRRVATVSGALMCLALLFPACFLADAIMAQITPDARLAYQVLATFVLFAGIPALACYFGRIRLFSGLQLAIPPWPTWIGALLLAVAAVPVMFQVIDRLQAWGLMFITSQMEQQIRALMPWGRAASPAPIVVVTTFALVGVAEEVFFRGFIFGALRGQAGQRLTIILSALLFGLFHFVSLVDRLIPSTLMGLLLGWVCWQTRSVLPGMLLHATYNGLMQLLPYLQINLGGPEELQELLRGCLIAAVPTAIVGALVVWRYRVADDPLAPRPEWQ
jgi:sodium transport system permease protein